MHKSFLILLETFVIAGLDPAIFATDYRVKPDNDIIVIKFALHTP